MLRQPGVAAASRGRLPGRAVMLGATMPTLSGTAAARRRPCVPSKRNNHHGLWRRHEIVTGSHDIAQDVELVCAHYPDGRTL